MLDVDIVPPTRLEVGEVEREIEAAVVELTRLEGLWPVPPEEDGPVNPVVVLILGRDTVTSITPDVAKVGREPEVDTDRVGEDSAVEAVEPALLETVCPVPSGKDSVVDAVKLTPLSEVGVPLTRPEVAIVESTMLEGAVLPVLPEEDRVAEDARPPILKLLWPPPFGEDRAIEVVELWLLEEPI
jgi:hypothetical protein